MEKILLIKIVIGLGLAFTALTVRQIRFSLDRTREVAK